MKSAKFNDEMLEFVEEFAYVDPTLQDARLCPVLSLQPQPTSLRHFPEYFTSPRSVFVLVFVADVPLWQNSALSTRCAWPQSFAGKVSSIPYLGAGWTWTLGSARL